MTPTPQNDLGLQLAERALSGEMRAAARLMRLAEDDPERARAALSQLFVHTGRAHIVGVTGNPGSGKSTLVAALIRRYRAQGLRVGVVAVDPSSPFTGGAILGDRVRMTEHWADEGVFIRSAASRGALGGISRATEDLVHIFDALGYEVVIVETLGVGQAEVDIMGLAQTTLVVLTPGYGDDVQALKAGLLEIADLFVVNKADQPGADVLMRQLRTLGELGGVSKRAGWKTPVVSTVARDDQGIDPLVAEIAAHREYLRGGPAGVERERARLWRLLVRLIEHEVRRRVERDWLPAGRRSELLEGLLARRRDPYTTAVEVVAAHIPGSPEPT